MALDISKFNELNKLLGADIYSMPKELPQQPQPKPEKVDKADPSKFAELNKLLGGDVFAKPLPPVPLRPDYVPPKKETKPVEKPKPKAKVEAKPVPKKEEPPKVQKPEEKLEDQIVIQGSPIVDSYIEKFKNKNETDLGNSVRMNYNKLIDKNMGSEDAAMKRSESMDKNADAIRGETGEYQKKIGGVTDESRNRLNQNRDFFDELRKMQLNLAAEPMQIDDSPSYAEALQKKLNEKMDSLQKEPKDIPTWQKLLAAFGPGVLAMATGEDGARAGVAAFKTSQDELDRVYKQFDEDRKSKREALGKEIEGTGKLLSAENDRRKNAWQMKKDAREEKFKSLQEVRNILSSMNEPDRARYVAELNDTLDLLKSRLSGDNDMSKAGANLGFQKEKETGDNFSHGIDKYAEIEDKQLGRANDLEKAKIKPKATPKPPKGVDPFDREMKLRKEFESRAGVKDFNLVDESYRKIIGADKTAVGDMSMMYAYIKLLDPGSAVKEGEYATAQNTNNVPDEILRYYNRAKDGHKLVDKQREQFKREALNLVRVHAISRKRIEEEFANILSQQNGLNPRNVFTPRADELLKGAKSKDEAALEWARKNPNDPRAKKIMEKLQQKQINLSNP